MHESLRLYDACLSILVEEEAAFAAQNEERLMELCDRRMSFMEQAWQQRAGCDDAALRAKLEAIQSAQENLTRKTRSEMETLRLALQHSRRENTRLAGYGKTVASRQSALIVSKKG